MNISIKITREGLRKHKKEVTAWLEGKSLQQFCGGKWLSTDSPYFNPESRYRVEPKMPSKLSCWVVYDKVSKRLVDSSMKIEDLYSYREIEDLEIIYVKMQGVSI